MNTNRRTAQVTAFAMAAVVTLSMLMAVNGLATGQHNGHDPLLAQKAAAAVRG
jgi:hypothetical protein